MAKKTNTSAKASATRTSAGAKGSRGLKGSKGGKGKNRPAWQRWIRGFLLIVTSVLTAGMVLSAYAGCFSPAGSHGYNGIVQMTFPLWLLGSALMFVIDFFVCRKGAIVVVAGVIACGGTVLDFMPVNMPHRSLTPEESSRAFRLMTYNVGNFKVLDRPEVAGEPNATVEYILDSDADIVCLQEAKWIDSTFSTLITDEQNHRMHERYKYVYYSAQSQMILSKYPVEPLRLDFPNEGAGRGLIAAYRVNIEGLPVTVFNVHLQSIGLDATDKSIYRELTDLRGPDSLKHVRTHLLDKLALASVRRGEQIDDLVRYMQHLGGPNVIVCGDFNDVPGSYALRTLCEHGLRQVYPKVGFGPMVTFNADRFYFRIDHVLWRGAMTPVRIKRGTLRTSDHYPLTTTFIIDQKQQT